MVAHSASRAGGFSPIEPPRVSVAGDGTIAAVHEASRVTLLELPSASPFAEIGVDPGALTSEVAWVGVPPRLLVLSRYATHTTVHLIDPYGPRTIAEIRHESPMRLFATVGASALVVGSLGAALLTAGESHLTLYPFPTRVVPVTAGAAAGLFVVALAGSIEEWDPQSRSPKRRLRLPRAAVITAVGGNERLVWMTTQQEPARIEVIVLVNRGQPKVHDLPEPIARISAHPRSDLIACVGADSGRLYVVDLDGRTRLRIIEPDGLDRIESAGLVVGRMTGVLAAQAGCPIAIVPLAGRETSGDFTASATAPLHGGLASTPEPPDARERGDDDPERGDDDPERGDDDPERGDDDPERGDDAPQRGEPEPDDDGADPATASPLFDALAMHSQASQPAPVPAAWTSWAASSTLPAPSSTSLAPSSTSLAPSSAPRLVLPASPAFASTPPAPAPPWSAFAPPWSALDPTTPPTRSDTRQSWRDQVVAWAQAITAGAFDHSAPAAPAFDALLARFDLALPLQPVLALLYGAHLCGQRGAAPVDVARLLDGQWDEALGRGELARRGVACYAGSRVVLSPVLLRVLDELPPTTGALVGEPGPVALLGPCVVVAGDEPLTAVADRCLARVGGAILAARDDADPAALVFEACAYGSAPMLRTSTRLETIPADPVIFVVGDAELADRFGVPRLA